jgi:thioredoxin reductase (NADPH)
MKTDLLIIGSGPAGLQAAIHASRRKIGTVVVGNIHDSSLKMAKVENYCCMELFSNGKSLLEKGRKQCEKFGVVFVGEDVMKVERNFDNSFVFELANGEKIEAVACVIATGIAVTKLGIKGENEYHGKGVSYCVDCDAGFFKDKRVAVVGNGSAAASGALILTHYAREVFLVSKVLEASHHLEAQLGEAHIIRVGHQGVKEIVGRQNRVAGLLLENGSHLNVDGVFIELGAKGALELFNPLGVSLDQEQYRYIETNKKQETNIAGLYAAGDVCGQPFQLAKAVGEGCVAGISASDYIKSMSARISLETNNEKVAV